MMIIKNSFKQLFRKPGKTILFFLLMTAATLLLVFGAGMYIQCLLRLNALEDIYSTVATVQQPWEKVRYVSKDNACFTYSPVPVEDYGEIITPEALDFPGANYLIPPENRPYYISYNPELNDRYGSDSHSPTFDLLEFTPLETTTDGSATSAVITKVIVSGDTHYVQNWSDWSYAEYPPMEEGEEFTVCQHQAKGSIPLEKGKTYIGCFGYISGNYKHTEDGISVYTEYAPILAPYTSLVDRQGNPLEGKIPQEAGVRPLLSEVTDGTSIDPWVNMVEVQKRNNYFGVLPVTDPDLVTSFRNNNVTVRGRMITDEEFESGAKVCLIDQSIAKANFLYEGKTIRLSLLASMYGDTVGSAAYYPTPFSVSGSMLDGDGNILEPFWDEEYEIVGIYSTRTLAKDLPFSDMMIIPARSVGASDEGHIIHYGPMTETNTSFMLPNGAQEEFAAALAGAVPESERLNITYDDMGYAQAVESLDGTRSTAFLLLLVGLLAAVAIIVLLLYFFVIKEKKRTAIERSLGQTKGQCRASILAGLLALTLLAAGLGSAGAGVLLNRSNQLAEAQDVMGDTGGELAVVESESGYKSDWGLGGIYNFSGQFSPWAMWDIKGNQAQLTGITVPLAVYIGAPLLLWGLVAALAVALVNRNLRIEPILLLGTRA